MKKRATTCVFTALVLLASPSVLAQARSGELDEAFWRTESDKASGKMLRGAGLAVLGFAAVVPSAIWIDRAFENPYRFAALGAVASLAAASMTLHGVNSVGFGWEERATANRFARLHREGSGSVDPEEERLFVAYSRRKSAAKMTLFGAVLAVQAAGLLANGVALSAMENAGGDIGGARIWPSYVFGGALLSAGTAVLVLGSRRLRALDAEKPESPSEIGSLSFLPWFYADGSAGGAAVGISGGMLF